MKITGKLLSVSVVESLSSQLQKMAIDVNHNEYIMFGDSTALTPLINKDVEFEEEDGIVENLAEVVVVTQKVETNDDVMTLIPSKSSSSSTINFDLSQISPGELQQAQTILFLSYTKSNSRVAKWYDMNCIDRNSKNFNLRIFYDSEFDSSVIEHNVGRYIICDIRYDSKYGLQVSGKINLLDIPVTLPAEVELAYETLKDICDESSDAWLDEYNKKFRLIDTLRLLVAENIGYHLVHMCAEIMLLCTMENIVEDLPLTLMKQAVFASRGYLIPSKTPTTVPAEFLNYHRLITTSAKDNVALIELITGVSEYSPLFKQVQDLATATIEKKGHSI
jgi:hypothetical protein